MTKQHRAQPAPSSPPVADSAYRKLVESVSDYAIFVLDPQGRIMTWNAGAEQIKGYKAEEIIGQHISRFYTQSAIDSRWPEHELAVARAEGRFEDEGWRVRRDGTTFWANVIITALRDESGALLGFAKITRDLTERRRHEESMRQSEERFRLLVEGVKDYAIFMLDTEGRVASWNVGAERIKGYAPAEIIGRHFSVFYPADVAASDWPTHELRMARTTGRFEDEGWRLRKDGSRFWANVVITAVHDRTGTLRGYAKLTRDLTQRQHVEALRQAGQQMSEFLAMLAHELRNPLAPIRNAMQIMRMHRLDNPKLDWCRSVVDRQVELLGRLVDDLLDVNRVTTGKVIIRKEAVELTAALDRAIESSSPLIEARKHRVEVSVPHRSMLVDGDLARLTQVFLNLLNNAAKFTPENGLIEVLASVEGDEAVVRVRDNGMGIAPDLLPTVFDLFVQGSRSLDRAEGGLGIGLTLVREILRLHGGTVEVASAGPQHGSEFTVRLPLHRAGAVETLSSAPQEPVPAQTGRRVLVVDDNTDSAETMALLLRSCGHEVHTAHEGNAAVEQARTYAPEVVLLDIGLPGMSGYMVAQKLREVPRLANVTLIAMTGYGQEEDRKRTREAGFDHHLVKPVDFATLARLLETAESEQRSER